LLIDSRMVAADKTLMSCQSRCFGALEFTPDSVLEFPDGIPAFEQERRFLAVRQKVNEPLVFLQSLATPDLCFATLPVQAVCSRFELHMDADDLHALGLASQPVPGREVLCLTIVSIEENAPPTANLLAPIVVNLRTGRGRQVILAESKYSHREELPLREAACS
jgi:flagellar assembly factor FliW